MRREGTVIPPVGYGEVAELNDIRALTETSIEEI